MNQLHVKENEAYFIDIFYYLWHLALEHSPSPPSLFYSITLKTCNTEFVILHLCHLREQIYSFKMCGLFQNVLNRHKLNTKNSFTFFMQFFFFLYLAVHNKLRVEHAQRHLDRNRNIHNGFVFCMQVLRLPVALWVAPTVNVVYLYSKRKAESRVCTQKSFHVHRQTW